LRAAGRPILGLILVKQRSYRRSSITRWKQLFIVINKYIIEISFWDFCRCNLPYLERTSYI